MDVRVGPVSLNGNQSWIFIGRSDAEAETPTPWPPDGKNWLIGKDPEAGEDWSQEEKGTTKDEMVGWHHQFNEHEFEKTPGDSDGQRSLACNSPRGRKELDKTERLINNSKMEISQSWQSWDCSEPSEDDHLSFIRSADLESQGSG